jgi:hypothetical protein
MSVAAAALIGAGILALVALILSVRQPEAGRSSSADAGAAMLRTVVAGGLATGFCLLAFSVAQASQLLPDWAELLALTVTPLALLMVARIGRARRAAPAAEAPAGGMAVLPGARPDPEPLG